MAGALALATACSPAPSPARSGPAPPGESPSPSSVARASLSITTAGFRLPAPVQRAVAVAAGKEVVLAGGLNDSGTSVAGVFRIAPSSGHVSEVGSVTVPFHDAAAATIDGRLIVFGGGSTSSNAAVQSFDLATGAGATIGQLPRPLSDLGAARIGRTVYVIGGYDGASPQPDIYSTRDGVAFHVAGKLPMGLRYPAVAAVGGKVVIAGGLSSAGDVSSVYEFDPTTSRVTRIARLPHPLAHAAAFTLGTAPAVYVVGGADDASGRTFDTVFRIDLARGAVHQLASLAKPVSDAAVAPWGNRILLLGGLRGHALDQVLQARLIPRG